MTDQIKKQIELRAPISRVWKALTDHKQFGEWFRVRLDDPFVPGKPSRGQILVKGYEHLHWSLTVQKIQPEIYFSYTWIPYGVDPNRDYTKETPTLVEFHLEKKGDGTLLTVTESGFTHVPEDRRAEAFRMNEGGWSTQIKNIEAYVTSKP